jgi:hypothetical protein
MWVLFAIAVAVSVLAALVAVGLANHHPTIDKERTPPKPNAPLNQP